MALEKRGGNYYYYKKEREGKRIVSKYYGKGELAGLVARMDEIERYQKAAEAEKQRRSKDDIEEIDRNLSLLESEIKKLTEAVLANSGFYKTKSREWRLKAK